MKRILLKNDGLAGTMSAPIGYTFIGYSNNVFSQRDESQILSIADSRRLVAGITQSGTASPTQFIIENRTDFTPTWSRVNTGTYNLVMTGAFVVGNYSLINQLRSF